MVLTLNIHMFSVHPENLATSEELTENDTVALGNKSLNVYLVKSEQITKLSGKNILNTI